MANEWVRGTVTLTPNTPPNHTITNAMNAIESALLQSGWERASWSAASDDRSYLRTDRATQDRWRYDADGPTQHSGIRLVQVSSDTVIRISSFLQNQAETDIQVDTRDASGGTFLHGYVDIDWDVTAPNTYLIIAGEDGLYIEAGRDGNPNNLGHGAIVTMQAVPELNATKDGHVRWTAQGFAMDLGGTQGCRFTETNNRNQRFVTNDGTSRNFTAWLALFVARGVTQLTTPNPSDHRLIRIANRDLLLGNTGFGANQDMRYACTFGVFNTPEDDRYRISLITMMQDAQVSDRAASSSSTSNTIGTGTSPDNDFRDVRHDRLMSRFVVCDYTLLPFINITDANTGIVYRVLEFTDNGRTANLGIEWPSTVITPAV